ncbi:histidine kinase [Winogradskyella sp. PG-2]|uniref:tetratricopeptide repeat-containing sensor histidine kinase n=1 Tax=Winogradskyella sp. PG-2 TaxID=754409 RepID=UPI0004586141|nr:histidine kinase [Winogradskyella sp. PG-2]BAO76871.1 hypothetical protein WPG_2641 [Winogradskyella sp. PG-2]
MKNLSLIIFLCIIFNAKAQNEELDSLKNRILNSKEIDTNYIDLRLQYATKKIYTQPDSLMLHFNEETLKLARSLDYTKGTISALEKVAITYQYVYSNPFRAIDYYQEGISLIETNDRYKPYKISFLNNIGSIYYQMQDFDLALKNFNQVLVDYPNDKNVLIAIATAYASLKEYEKSIHYFNIVEEESRKSTNYPFLANILCNKSFSLLETKKYDKAIETIEECLELVNKHNIEIIRLAAYINASTIYLQTEDYEEAQKYSDLAFELSKKTNRTGLEYSLWEIRANIYAAKKDYKNALETYHKSVKIKDSITSIDRKLEISRKEIKYEADKKNAIAQEEVKRQKLIKNGYLFGGLSLGLASIIGFIIYRRKQRAITKAKEAEFQANISETELKVLRSQMNPHFISNSLNSIGDYIIKNDIDEASDYLAKFAHLMRKTLINSEKDSVLLKDDLQILKTYLEIERKRFKNAFDYEFNISENIDLENILVPPLIIQPFLENSIKHGIASLKSNGFITINIKANDSTLTYTIDDNGIGRQDKKENKQNKSYGIDITSNRIKIINQQKDSNGFVKIVDKDQGVQVIVQLPLEEKN